MAHKAPAKDTDRHFEEVKEGETYSVDAPRTDYRARHCELRRIAE